MLWAAGVSFTVSCLAAATNTNRFGFTGPEIFPIENQISQLHVADLDGDGLNDIIVVNNARSRINLLYNQTGKTNLTQKPKPAGKREPERAAARCPLPHRIHCLRETHLLPGRRRFEWRRPARPRLLRRPPGVDRALQPGHQRLERPQTLAH